METKHPFICVDSTNARYYEIDEEGEIVHMSRLPGCCFDIWRLPDGNRLCAVFSMGVNGYALLDGQGNTIRTYSLPEGAFEVFGCQPLPNGNVLLGDLQGKRLVEVDPEGAMVCVTPLFYDGDHGHEVMRMPRLCRNGKDYLVTQPGIRKIIRYAKDGTILWQAHTRPDTFDALEKKDGTVLYSCIEGIFQIDREGNEIWGVTPADLPEVGLCWALGLQLLPSGNVVVCNWLGHGKEGRGVPIFELDSRGKVVWQCKIHEKFRTLSSFHLLDTDASADCYTPLK